jgi:hypothetical protein
VGECLWVAKTGRNLTRGSVTKMAEGKFAEGISKGIALGIFTVPGIWLIRTNPEPSSFCFWTGLSFCLSGAHVWLQGFFDELKDAIITEIRKLPRRD